MNEQQTQALLALYSQIATLKLLPRTGWLQRGVVPAESVADHTFGVATLALLLADTVEGVDRGKLLAIALIHDLAEVSLGDLPASARRFLAGPVKHDAERRALDALLTALPNRLDYVALWEEYCSGSSREARLVKGIDRLEMLIQAFAYERAGNRGLAEFWVNADQGWCDEFPILQAIAMQLLAQRETR